MNLQLKVPPIIVAVLAGLIAWLSSKFPAIEFLNYDFPLWTERVLIVLGFLIGIAGVVQFAQSKTSINPHSLEKTNVLVSEGIYRFSRNPMYLALLILVIVFGMKIGNLPGIVFGAAFFIVYMNTFQIKPEEEMLAEKFGQDYVEYREKVRRWI